MKSIVINDEYLNEKRLCYGTCYLEFDNDNDNETEIVPNELNHDHLLNNFNIDEPIYEYYCLSTKKLINDAEFEEMKKHGFVGKKETALKPYSINIFGAFYSRSDFHYKLNSIALGSVPRKINNKPVKYITDLIPYFKEYAKGFENGFNEFDNTQIKPFLTLLADKQDYVNKVFEYLTKHIAFKHSWAFTLTGFKINYDYQIVGAFEDGQKQGYFYKAWSIVFSNNNLFAPLFQQYFKELQPQPIVKQKPELKIDQIALKYAYEGLQITRENGNEIAKEYGHNSGEKLFQRFTYFSSSANRKGKPNLCTPKKLDNKIRLIESIIELLPTDKQERAKDEVSILKKIYEAEYQ
ncbi:hypothetical protein MG290_03180 [Flavobacterium sp. CBA20B-1]|uniref:hypothetical protein n=1 Tax=unclassified Flavobacterium TaxID=196869 RepID=UPI00222445E9|nr:MULTISPECIES: hypothetical protein [unclassified Flavobacterium]WCM42696.1 hypothetical protein MG290_03180 [Flavobacterium sp. CBA20B-1]